MAELGLATAATAVETGELGDEDGRTLSNRQLLRALLRKPQFILCTLTLLTFFTMAAVPRLFTSVDPRDCVLSRSRGSATAGHPFGFDVQGCDYLANVIYGARPSVWSAWWRASAGSRWPACSG